MAFQSINKDKAPGYDGVEKSFRESVVSALKIEVVRSMILLPPPSRDRIRQIGAESLLHPYPYSSKDTHVTIPIEEYADYDNLDTLYTGEKAIENATEKAKRLGYACGVLYNTLLKNAQRNRGHKVAWDLLAEDNLKFNYILNAEPSVADPMGIIPGWVAFRFHFASSNSVEHLCMESATLKALEQKR